MLHANIASTERASKIPDTGCLRELRVIAHFTFVDPKTVNLSVELYCFNLTVIFYMLNSHDYK